MEVSLRAGNLIYTHMFSVLGKYCTNRCVCECSVVSLEFSRQEYWSGFSFPTPVDLPHPGIKPVSLASATLAGGLSW